MLDRLLEPVGRCLNRESAEKILQLRADRKVQKRVDELAQKCNEGTLTTEELAEYQRYVAAGSLIAILKAQSQLIVAGSKIS